jgi:hypothetical protein
MNNLSPAAQAVLDGFRAVPTLMDGPSIAGALRAAADEMYFVADVGVLNAIAAELEGNIE